MANLRAMLSLPKILLVLAILAAVIIGTRLMRSWSARPPRDSVRDGKKKDATSVEMVKCGVCGDFVELSTGACGRADCPRPG